MLIVAPKCPVAMQLIFHGPAVTGPTIVSERENSGGQGDNSGDGGIDPVVCTNFSLSSKMRQNSYDKKTALQMINQIWKGMTVSEKSHPKQNIIINNASKSATQFNAVRGDDTCEKKNYGNRDVLPQKERLGISKKDSKQNKRKQNTHYVNK